MKNVYNWTSSSSSLIFNAWPQTIASYLWEECSLFSNLTFDMSTLNLILISVDGAID